MTNEQIKDIALANGFKLKEQPNGEMDLNPYVYEFARALSPSKVFELTYDYGDGYFTVFMTINKQHALDFIELVRAKDKDFNERYGRYEDCDERIAEAYNESHPLKPYKKAVFNHTYEHSFSEWAIEYAGETHAQSMSVIEHELREVTK